MLAAAVERFTPITLTHRSDVGWVSYTSQFLGVRAPGKTINIGAPVPRRTYLGVGLPLGETLGVAFRAGHKKCLFCGRLGGPSPSQADAAFTLSWPDALQQVRRRSYERAAPPPGLVIPVRFWVVTHSLGKPPAEQGVRYGELEDLSAGGMRVLIADLAGIDDKSTYRCVFAPKPHAAPIVAEAVVRHREAAAGGRTSLGLAFVGLEATEEGRAALADLVRVVAQFQRLEGTSRPHTARAKA